MPYSAVAPSCVYSQGVTITGSALPERARPLLFQPPGGAATVGDLMVVGIYTRNTDTPAGWTGPAGWQLAGQRTGVRGGMAIWTKTVAEADVSSAAPGYSFDGPDYLSGVLAAYTGTAGLDGPPAFAEGTGTIATAAHDLAARADTVLAVFGSQHGDGFVLGAPLGILAGARYPGVVNAAAADAVPGTDLAEPFTATTYTSDPAVPASSGWLAATVALLPAIIPGPPEHTPPGVGGIHFSPGTFQPEPVLTLNGLDVPAAAGDPTRPVVLDGFTVTWGRTRVFDQPEPSTGTVRLWFADPAHAAAWAAADGLPGQLLSLSWQGTLPGDTDLTRRAFFTGRIASLKLTAHTSRRPDGRPVRGAIAELSLASVLNDLANTTIAGVSWPEEPMADRLARLAPYAAPYATVALRGFYAAADVAPVEPGGSSTLLAEISALYDSCGADRMTYLPDTSHLAPVLRRRYDGLRGLAQLWADPAGTTGPGRAGQGVYIRALGVYPVDGTAADTSVPNYLDAAALAYDPAADGFTLGPDNRLTRVELSFPDSTAPDPYTTTTIAQTVPGINEATAGIRAATISSQLVWPDWAADAAANLVDMAAGEGQEFTLAELVWETTRTGGFETVEQVELLLAGYERGDLVFLGRSQLPQWDIRPIYGVMGGQIGYADGGWVVAITLAPVKPPTVPQHAISWEEIGADVEWHDGPHPAGLHETVTYDDLRYVAMGLGATEIPADTGWDT